MIRVGFPFIGINKSNFCRIGRAKSRQKVVILDETLVFMGEIHSKEFNIINLKIADNN